MTMEYIQQNIWLFAALAVWELIWKGLALWRAARKEQKPWFIALLIINSVGVLPILYLTLFSKKR